MLSALKAQIKQNIKDLLKENGLAYFDAASSNER
jgi:hypothetical protein